MLAVAAAKNTKNKSQVILARSLELDWCPKSTRSLNTSPPICSNGNRLFIWKNFNEVFFNSLAPICFYWWRSFVSIFIEMDHLDCNLVELELMLTSQLKSLTIGATHLTLVRIPAVAQSGGGKHPSWSNCGAKHGNKSKGVKLCRPQFVSGKGTKREILFALCWYTVKHS